MVAAVVGEATVVVSGDVDEVAIVVVDVAVVAEEAMVVVAAAEAIIRTIERGNQSIGRFARPLV